MGVHRSTSSVPYSEVWEDEFDTQDDLLKKLTRPMGKEFGKGLSRESYKRSGPLLAVEQISFGSPTESYRLKEIETIDLASVGANEVILKILGAPINPADVNVAQGVYGTKKPVPCIAGMEGVAVVQAIGSAVKTLQTGDWVLPHGPALGTWTMQAKVDESAVIKIADDLPFPYAATLGVNPCTAYRLLRDFVSLKKGDVIIQNGANSMVGYAVIQMCREMGVTTINVVRSDRPDVDKVTRLLTNMGGDINIPDTYVNTRGFREIMADLPPIKLALDCIGGEVLTHMSRVVAPEGTIVTYGSMSKKPIEIPFDLLTSKQLKLRGFWISKWISENSVEARREMLDEVTDMIRRKQLSFFFEVHDLDDFQFALQRSQERFSFRKVSKFLSSCIWYLSLLYHR
jgi:trans-2-enoyl-CoA reductase